MRHLTLAVGFGVLLAACATGAVVDPLDLGPDPSGGGSADPASLDDASSGDESTPPPPWGSHDAASAAETGAAADSGVDSTVPADGGGGVDSAPPPPPPPPPPPAGPTCTGTYSTQVVDPIFGLPMTYDDACDGEFNAGDTSGNACTPGGNDCASLDNKGGWGIFCCYKPPSGSHCYSDYNGKPQCIPK
jgi:hypothetical protein